MPYSRAQEMHVDIDVVGDGGAWKMADDHHAGHEHSFNDMHACIHDDLLGNFMKSAGGWPDPAHQVYSGPNQPYPGPHGATASKRRAQASDYQSIRIHVDVSRLEIGADRPYACHNVEQTYRDTQFQKLAGGAFPQERQCLEADVITPEKRDYLVNDLIPTTVQWLRQALSVRPVQGRLALPQVMSSAVCDGSLFYNGFVCCDDQMIPEHKSPGVANADYVMHVTMRPIRGSIVAWAFPCQNDQSRRPISGQINFVPHKVDTSPEALRSSFIKSLHELFHNLGFSDAFFPYYRKPGTDLPIFSSVSRVYSAALQKTVATFTMENAVDKMKEHFDCFEMPSSYGVELEDGGGGATAGKHLEERLFYNELMSGWIHQNSRPTAVSLAFLQDSGWYQVDYSSTESMGWGKGEGCDFLLNRCDQWPDRYFCQEPNEDGCSPDLLSKGVCNAYSSGAPFESKYQYFPDDPTKGGKFSGADFCPFYAARSNGDCSASTTPISFFYGEATGSGSRCMMGDFQLASYSRTRTHHGACLRTSCLRNQILQIQLAPGRPYAATVECPVEGGSVDLGSLPETSSDWSGFLECPPARLLCDGDPCSVQDCSGHGRCQSADGSCICDSGYYGEGGFSCDRRRCPVGPLGTECSGNGDCDASTGVCTDGDGLPGCFPGFKGLDCSELGCPEAASPQCNDPDGCECSARGTCTEGICQCEDGYISSDCSLTQCPGSPSCGGNERGSCDQTNGLCECGTGISVSEGSGTAVYYAGSGCQIETVGTMRPRVPIHFNGELNATSGAAMGPLDASLPSEEYVHFDFAVPSVDYNYQLVVEATSWSSSGTPLAPRVVAAYETFGTPTLRRHQFLAQEVPGQRSQREIVFRSENTGDGPSTFNEVGTMLVSVVAQAATEISISLSRDGCAVLDCGDHGTCVQGQCLCQRHRELQFPVRQYGFSGVACEQFDCPGSPDCGGARGVCQAPNPAAGTPLRRQFPSCNCTELFEGESCQMYALPQGTSVLGAALDPLSQYARSDDGNPMRIASRAGGALVANYTGTLEVGEQVDRVLIDPSQLQTCCGVNGTASVLVTLDARASGDGTDPMLLARRDLRPTLIEHDQFDDQSWATGGQVHEILLAVRQGELAFVSVRNGRYSTRRLQYLMRIELASGTCAPSLQGCSGHGIGSCQEKCNCALGWEGIRCDLPTPVLTSGAMATTPVLAPGQETFFVHPIPDDAAEVRVSARPGFANAPGARFVLKAAFERTRNGRSLGKLYNEAALFDYEGQAAFEIGVGSRAANATAPGAQNLVIARPDSTSRFLFLSIRNLPQATGDAIADLAIVSHPASSLTACEAGSTAEQCGAAQCSGRGLLLERNGEPFCECEPGWAASTRCASPKYASFSRLQDAAQNVDYLCSICELELEMESGGLAILKVPPPLQIGSTVTLEVVALQGNDEPGPASATRRQLQLATVGDDDALGGDSSSLSSLGSMSLLGAGALPRSISDFSSISRTGSNTSLQIAQSGSATSFFVAAHAHRGGTFRVRARRSQMVYEEPATEYLIQEVMRWILGTQQGLIVFGMAITFVTLVVLGCLFDQCAPDWMKFCCTGGNKTGKEEAALKIRQQRVVSDVQSLLRAPSTRRLVIGGRGTGKIGTVSSSSIGQSTRLPAALRAAQQMQARPHPRTRVDAKNASSSSSSGSGSVGEGGGGGGGGRSIVDHKPSHGDDDDSLPSDSDRDDDDDLELDMLPPGTPSPGQGFGIGTGGMRSTGGVQMSQETGRAPRMVQAGSRGSVRVLETGRPHHPYSEGCVPVTSGQPGAAYGGMPLGMSSRQRLVMGGAVAGGLYCGAPPGLSGTGTGRGVGMGRQLIGGAPSYRRYVGRKSQQGMGMGGGGVAAGAAYYRAEGAGAGAGGGSMSGRRMGSRRSGTDSPGSKRRGGGF